MKNLVIVRHGEGQIRNAFMEDIRRPLTRRGHHNVAVAAAEFTSLGLQVDAVVSSPAQRALETADIWLHQMHLPKDRLRVDEEIYEAERSDIIGVVRGLDNAHDTVVLVGHNPGLTGLLRHLTGSNAEIMSRSSFAIIKMNVDCWSRISLKDSELTCYYQPPPKDRLHNPWQRFLLWRRMYIRKIELATVFVVGLLVILTVILFMMHASRHASDGFRGGVRYAEEQ